MLNVYFYSSFKVKEVKKAIARGKKARPVLQTATQIGRLYVPLGVVFHSVSSCKCPLTQYLFL